LRENIHGSRRETSETYSPTNISEKRSKKTWVGLAIAMFAVSFGAFFRSSRRFLVAPSPSGSRTWPLMATTIATATDATAEAAAAAAKVAAVAAVEVVAAAAAVSCNYLRVFIP
jgi:hypothetical protein